MIFKAWKEENGEVLNEEYLEYKYEYEQAGAKLLSFEKWVKEQFKRVKSYES